METIEVVIGILFGFLVGRFGWKLRSGKTIHVHLSMNVYNQILTLAEMKNTDVQGVTQIGYGLASAVLPEEVLGNKILVLNPQNQVLGEISTAISAQ